MGLEPTIFGTTIRRVNQLHYTHHILLSPSTSSLRQGSGTDPFIKYDRFERVNEPGGIRTLDLRLRRPLLYPAELQTHILNPLRIKKAGDGNRTHVSSLEGWCSTIELHPHIGVTGFEPATSWSQTRRSSQAEPHPDVFFMLRHLRDTICIIGHVFLNVNTFFKFFYFLFFSEFFKVNAGILPTFTPIHITALTDTLSQRMPFPLCLMSLPCSSAVCRSVLDKSYYPDST